MDASLSQSREVYMTWAPSESIWSPWAKPVLFAQINPALLANPQPAAPTSTSNMDVPSSSINPGLPAQPAAPAPSWDMAWLSTVDRNRTAIIVNLPGPESVKMGVILAQNGYQPVPLYNSCNGPSAVVPVDGIQAELVASAMTLRSLSIDSQGSPAFLIDSQRLKGAIPPAPGRFDNRWIVFPQDLPSGTFLRSRGIDQVILLQREGIVVEDDLAAVFSRWHKAGLQLLAKNPSDASQGLAAAEPPVSIAPPRRSGFNTWIPTLALMSMMGRRSNVGGFGTIVPDPTRTSSYG